MHTECYVYPRRHILYCQPNKMDIRRMKVHFEALSREINFFFFDNNLEHYQSRFFSSMCETFLNCHLGEILVRRSKHYFQFWHLANSSYLNIYTKSKKKKHLFFYERTRNERMPFSIF